MWFEENEELTPEITSELPVDDEDAGDGDGDAGDGGGNDAGDGGGSS